MRWQLDSGGAYSSGLVLSTSQLISEATNLNVDFNSEAIVESSHTTIETDGNASLLRQAGGLAEVRVGGTEYPVGAPCGPGTGDASSDWQMLAAENIAGQNQILWRHSPGNFYDLWNLNSC